MATCFNPRTRVGCEHFDQKPQWRNWFQSTHPCGVRSGTLRRFVKDEPEWDSFNPRTRVGCELTLTRAELNYYVSIHAPVWGANSFDYSESFGASFNPRTRVGCELASLTCHSVTAVSIHAPVWGAKQRLGRWLPNKLFQSTHPCGVRKRKASRY